MSDLDKETYQVQEFVYSIIKVQVQLNFDSWPCISNSYIAEFSSFNDEYFHLRMIITSCCTLHNKS